MIPRGLRWDGINANVMIMELQMIMVATSGRGEKVHDYVKSTTYIYAQGYNHIALCSKLILFATKL